MIRAVIFDFDGLILETEVPVFQSLQELFEEHGGNLPLSTWQTSIGSTDLFDPFAYLSDQIGRPVNRARLRAKYRQRVIELVATKPILPGVQAYLDEAKEMNLRIAVASSSPREWVVGHLSRIGIAPQFDCIKCSDDVKRTKPDPELFLTVLEALEVRTEEAIVLEDSPNGVKAARAAGIFTVAVPGPLTRDHALDEANLRLTSLTDMPLRQVIEIATSKRKPR